MDDLAILGPVTVFKLRFVPPGTERRYVAELWFYPDGSRVLELSTKCQPSEAFAVAAEAKATLVQRNIDLAAPQQTRANQVGARVSRRGAHRTVMIPPVRRCR